MRLRAVPELRKGPGRPVSEKKRNAFHVEPSTHPETGQPEWLIVDDRGGIWGSFSRRHAATACLKGFASIGFVPRPVVVTGEGGGHGQPA